MRCIGAAGCNVAVSVSLDTLRQCYPASLPVLPFSTDAVCSTTAAIVIRVGHTTPKECGECYNTLRAFAGWRVAIDITAELRARLLRVVPTVYQSRVCQASQALLMPDFGSCPSPSCCTPHMDVVQGVAMRMGNTLHDRADLVVELKPKAAWIVPVVQGIRVDGVTYLLHQVKLQRCRFSLMRAYKSQERDRQRASKGAGYDGVQCGARRGCAYCPNDLYDASRSTSYALQALLRDPQNNLRVTRRGVPLKATLTPHELTYVAQTLDVVELWPVLVHLQLYGLSPRSEQAAAGVPVLDIELLYRWSQAKDMQSVRWLVPGVGDMVDCAESTNTTLSRCACASEVTDTQCAVAMAQQVGLRAMLPLADLDICVDRFYTATTARDVSVMVAAVAPSDDVARLLSTPPTLRTCCEGVYVDFGYPHHYVFRVAVIDLDCKRHKPLAYYWQRDRDILRAWREEEGEKEGYYKNTVD